MTDRNRVIVLGIDGASWNIIEPLVAAGKLPAFAKLLQNGAHGKLQSIIPPLSVPAWKCYSTGKNPGKLGVYDFLKLDWDKRKFTVVSSRHFHGRDIWDYAGEAGLTSCIYNMFSTHPAKEVRGCLISDFPNERGFYPPALKAEIEREFGTLYQTLDFGRDKRAALDSALEEIKLNFRVLRYLIDKYNPDFTHVSITRTDTIQHFLWGENAEKDSEFGESVEKAWVTLDGLISEFLDFVEKKYGERCYLFVISDHGFEEIRHTFNTGDWLVRKGYLKLRKNGRLIRASFFLHKLSRFVFPLFNYVTRLRRRLSPKNDEKRRVAGMQTTATVYEKTLDWENSAVMPLTGEILYFNKRVIKDSQAFAAKLIWEISEIKTPDGLPMTARVVYGAEHYGVAGAPDLLILPANVEMFNAPLVPGLWSSPSPKKWQGKHNLYGTLIISGPGVKKGHEIEGSTLYDIAPTILNLFGIAVPPDMDGNILQDAFGDEK